MYCGWEDVPIEFWEGSRQAIAIAGVLGSPLYSIVCTAAFEAPLGSLGPGSAAGIPVGIAESQAVLAPLGADKFSAGDRFRTQRVDFPGRPTAELDERPGV